MTKWKTHKPAMVSKGIPCVDFFKQGLLLSSYGNNIHLAAQSKALRRRDAVGVHFAFLGSPLNPTPNLNLISPPACGLGARLRLGMTTQKSGMRQDAVASIAGLLACHPAEEHLLAQSQAMANAPDGLGRKGAPRHDVEDLAS
jgi:hypothetical protein